METTEKILVSPFQLFDSFTEKDHDKFFGRDEQRDILYQLIQETNVVLLYGESGTGKTSLVQCGLINKTKHFNWTSITVRRLANINDALRDRLVENAELVNPSDKNKYQIGELLKEVYLTSFQPVLLIFDQFEELYVFGTPEERMEFYKTVRELLKVDICCKFIFIIREEFLARLNEFEKVQPSIFRKKLRIQFMDRESCRAVIVNSCRKFGIILDPLRPDNDRRSEDLVEQIIHTVAKTEELVHLPYLQVFLDTMWKEVMKQDPQQIVFNEAVVKKVGDLGNVLKAFLEEKVNSQKLVNKEDAWKVLKLFVSDNSTPDKATKKVVTHADFEQVHVEPVAELVDYFRRNRIIKNCAANAYELAHESLVGVIQGIKIIALRKKLENPSIHENPYKGLEAYGTQDAYRFYGRREVIKALHERSKAHPMLVVVGNSGAGKSSLIKAGLFPELIKENYTILEVIRAGDRPLYHFQQQIDVMKAQSNGKFILLVDQFEELKTRINEPEVRDQVYELINNLVEGKADIGKGNIVKVVITIRADFEPQFSICEPLKDNWRKGKFIVPPFSREEICEIIEEPAYQAGLEFSPPSLIDTIANEVYSSQATGLLPLMSFTLSELYKCYEASRANDKLLKEADYIALGGVIGGLQARAERIFHEFEEHHPSDFDRYQLMMKNIVLRMVYLSAGELAGQRVWKKDLEYGTLVENLMAEEVLSKLKESHLVLSGHNSDKQVYYEPAHDVLVRTWGRIWDWIGNSGKDFFLLQSRVCQAVEDYEATKQESLLWHNNPWLDSMSQVMHSRDCWLNKHELDFIKRSIEKKKEIEDAEQRRQEEQLEYQKQKLDYQKQKTRRKSGYIVLLSLALVSIGFFAFSAWRENKRAEKNLGIANANLDVATSARATADVLSESLKIQIASNKKAYDSVSSLHAETTIAKEKAEVARQNQEKANAALQHQILITNAAKATVEKQARTLQQQKDSLTFLSQNQEVAIKRIKDLYDSLEKNTSRIRVLYDSLTAKSNESSSQLLAISKDLRNRDIVKSYRVAELAYNRDTTNTEVAGFYHWMANRVGYYPVKQMEGSFSAFSHNGSQFMTVSNIHGQLKLWETGSLYPLDSLILEKDLVSAEFAPQDDAILLTYLDRIEFRNIKKLRDVNFTKWKGEKISYAALSPYSKRVLVVDEGILKVGTNFWNEMFLKVNSFKTPERILYAVFAPDNEHIIASSERGSVYVISLSGKLERTLGNSKESNTAFLSPKGNFFLISSEYEISLYNHKGDRVKSFSRYLDTYRSLDRAVFSLDGKFLLLDFSFITSRQQQLQQKSGLSDSYSSMIIQIDLDKDFRQSELKDLLDERTFTSTLQNGKIVVQGLQVMVGRESGLITKFNSGELRLDSLAGHQSRITSISLRPGGYIITSSNDNSTRLWVFDTPVNLDAKGVLPRMSYDEMGKLILNK